MFYYFERTRSVSRGQIVITYGNEVIKVPSNSNGIVVSFGSHPSDIFPTIYPLVLWWSPQPPFTLSFTCSENSETTVDLETCLLDPEKTAHRKALKPGPVLGQFKYIIVIYSFIDWNRTQKSNRSQTAKTMPSQSTAVPPSRWLSIIKLLLWLNDLVLLCY